MSAAPHATMRLLTIAMAFTLPSAASAAPMVTFKLCVNFASTTIDSGRGGREDNWTDPGTDVLRYARGMRVRVYNGSTNYLGSDSSWSGPAHLSDGITAPNDGAGCRTLTAPAGNVVSLKLWSDGRIQNNEIRVSSAPDFTDNPWYGQWAASVTTTFTVPTVAGTVKVLNVVPTTFNDRFNVYMVMAYALYRHAGGMTNKVYRAVVNSPLPCGLPSSYASQNALFDCSSPPDGVVDISPNTVHINSLASAEHSKRKFLVGHEMGHQIGDFIVGDPNGGTHKLIGQSGKQVHNSGPCRHYDGFEPFCDSGPCEKTGIHSMESWEWSSMALQEGFAHFYAADVFNSHAETDCWFRYYKVTTGWDERWVNCSDNTGDTGQPQPPSAPHSTHAIYPMAYMETKTCSPYASHGTELDWMRALWGVHTNAAGIPCGAGPPHFNTIASWLLTAPTWGVTFGVDNTYATLQTHAAVVSTSFGCLWSGNAPRHGVDH